MISITGSEKSGNVYLDKTEKTRITFAAIGNIALTTIWFSAPIFAALAFHPAFLFCLGLSFILTGAYWEWLDDNGINFDRTIIGYKIYAQYDTKEAHRLASTLVSLSAFEEELKNFVVPESLYREAFTKIDNYSKLIGIKSETALKDIESYTEKLLLQMAVCVKLREDNLLMTSEVLNSSLEVSGIIPDKDK